MSEQQVNGHLRCQISNEDTRMIEETHQAIIQLSKCAPHFEKIASAVMEIRDKSFDAAIGRGWIDVATMNKMIRSDRMVFGVVVMGLLFVIVFLLTGEKAEWLKLGR